MRGRRDHGGFESMKSQIAECNCVCIIARDADRHGCLMNSLTILAGAALLIGAATLLALRLLRDRMGEMPRLLLSPLSGYGVFVGGSCLFGWWEETTLPPEWYLLGMLLAGFWAMIVIVWAADEGRDLPPEDRTPQGRWRTGLLGRHWRGEVPLWGAFWIIFVWLTPLIFAVSRAFVNPLDLDLSIDEETYQLTRRGFTAFAVALFGWSLRGLWKSSLRSRAASRGSTLRALPALGTAGLSAVGLVVLAAVAIGLVASAVHRSWFDPGYERLAEIRVVRGGREIAIDGYFSPGIARRFGLLLVQAPNARIVHLNSLGGSMDEAFRLAILIRRRGLDTYVVDKCYSACTLTFAAGRRRWVTDEALIGFHAPAVGMLHTLGVPHRVLQGMIADEYYGELGVDARLIARIRETPFDRFIEPLPEELRDYGFTTDTADPDQFAASAWAISDWDSAATYLKTHFPILKNAARLHPEKFDAIVEKLRIEYEVGSPPSEIYSSLRPLMNDIIEMSIHRATDELMRN